MKYPDSKQDIYNAVFEQLSEVDISDTTAALILQEIKKHDLLLQISEKAYAATQGRALQSEILTLAQSLEQIEAGNEAEAEGLFVSTDLEEILNGTLRQPGIRWPLQCLNVSLGSLRKGDFGFIFARPETGKTTFVASVVGSALSHATGSVLWFNNEEVGEKVMLRVYQSYFGLTSNQLISNAAKYKALFKEKVGDNFKLLDSANISRATVEKVLQQHKPGLVVFDQIDKLKGFKADREDLVYGEIYQWARELAKQYCPVIGVCQAGGMAEGQRWLTMDHVANAKTSKQAEADWILGIGKSHDPNEEMVRFLNISKNKLLGDEDGISELRHGRFEVLIQPEIARYKDIVNYA